ncbi:UDP-N-acetylmuramoyl-tripeptide--D-alanyl-D-alanine ligase [Candidatus Acetothermia bacterium]|jgi:UDP-N-acetylmuramoyl-tripeptide--D-alanyl-D-alanine ligase|nr:UDP-N-acetylmuramoyl-tripeptide--D-alanyl-D-alanine ligase [Candidatus Acetothermia bacterium]MCI2427459.1 UDP-N-acetylmuramoyl-tripeptide--D-alanyl-D-alanine ligase [Candidatus Acetothermia bacterium]MCI2428860.1 UDP-N-acetylmuramoyl-tripeptide--D-alanyl-D-alanine ligase [Candidatus Acetothermia bacterium]
MFSCSEIAHIVTGSLLLEDNAAAIPIGFTHDSRLLAPGEVFIALLGKETDGHYYVPEAFARGAIGAIISDRTAIPTEGRNIILVDDPLQALHSLARQWRRRFSVPIIGVAGSCGKTTTKEMIAHLLRPHHYTFVSPGNYNTEYGLPLALLKMDEDVEVGIFELGEERVGDIALLVDILAPTIGVVTMIGRAHLEFLQNSTRVAEEIWQMVNRLPSDGYAILNADSPILEILRRRSTVNGISFGIKKGDLRAAVTDRRSGLHLELTAGNEQIKLISPLLGEHNSYNILAAVAVARLFDIPWKEIQRGVTSFLPYEHRLSLHPSLLGYILDDSYNANPDSTAAALRVLVELDLPVKYRAFIFGDMLELGKETPKFHRYIMELAIKLGIDFIFPIGDNACTAAAGLRSGSLSRRIIISEDKELLQRQVEERLSPGENLILIKGSRAMGLEVLAKEWRSRDRS